MQRSIIVEHQYVKLCRARLLRESVRVSVVRSQTDDRDVVRLTIARPEVKNAFDAEVVARLTEHARAIAPTARAVVLGSEGDVFCAGADLSWMRAMGEADRDANLADARALAEMYAALDALPMPLIARVQGAAIGGGAGLVGVTDFAIASRRATFAFGEVRVGIVPAVVSPYVVRKIGAAHATAIFVTGERFDAERAYEIGLVQRVVEPDALDDAVEETIASVLSSAPEAVRVAKWLVRQVHARLPKETRDLTVDTIASIRATEDAKEGFRAFLERRRPRWEGR